MECVECDNNFTNMFTGANALIYHTIGTPGTFTYDGITFINSIYGWIASDTTIQDAVNAVDSTGYDAGRGHISTWNTTNVTNMSYLFMNKTTFNQDINNWDVSNVTNMEGMFYNATAFNQDMSSWDVSNVTTMDIMFVNASAFKSQLCVQRDNYGRYVCKCKCF